MQVEAGSDRVRLICPSQCAPVDVFSDALDAGIRIGEARNLKVIEYVVGPMQAWFSIQDLGLAYRVAAVIMERNVTIQSVFDRAVIRGPAQILNHIRRVYRVCSALSSQCIQTDFVTDDDA